jgi:hypothetical protein
VFLRPTFASAARQAAISCLAASGDGRAQEHAPPPCKTLYAPIAVGRAGRLPPALD